MGQRVKKKGIIAKLLIAGNQEFDNGNYVTAKTYFDQLVDLDPTNLSFRERRGYCNFATSRQIDAIRDFDVILSIDSLSQPSAYFYRSLCKMRLGQYEASNRDIDKALIINPRLKAAYNNRGMNFLHLQDTTKACESFRKGVLLGDENAENNFSKYCQ